MRTIVKRAGRVIERFRVIEPSRVIELVEITDLRRGLDGLDHPRPGDRAVPGDRACRDHRPRPFKRAALGAGPDNAPKPGELPVGVAPRAAALTDVVVSTSSTGRCGLGSPRDRGEPVPGR